MELTTKEAAEKLNVKVRQVQALIESGRLPARRFGRAWVVNEKDLDLVKERKKTGRPKKETAK